MTIGERIKQIRDATGLSMEGFGKRIKMTRSNISRWEKGQIEVSDRNIKLICEEFNVNEEWLKTGEGEMYATMTDDEKFMKSVAELIKDDRDEIQKMTEILPDLTDEQLKALYNLALLLRKDAPSK